MRIDEYISDLRRKNIIVTVHDGQLAVSDSDDVLTSEIVEELKARKNDIIRFFKTVKKQRAFEAIEPAPTASHYPLSSAQRRMYFLYEFDKGGTTYNMPGFYRIDGKLNVAQLESTFKELVVRHQSLRTVFEIVDDIPMQRVVESNLFEMTYHRGKASEVDAYIDGFVRPFDLSSELPIRVSLMEVENEPSLLLIDTHHIVNDGVSQDILMRDFWLLYHGEVLEDMEIQYTDYAIWQQGDSHQALVSAHKSYWLEQFSETVSTLELPTDYSRSSQAGDQGGVYTISLDKLQSKRLKDIANQEEVTMYTLFLAIYNVLLGKLSNQGDIVVGTPTAGRYHADLEGMVGMFVNTLALRNRLDSEMNFMDFLSTVKESTLSAFENQSYQYEELVEELDISRDIGRNPLFDVFFSYGEEAQKANQNKSDIEIKGHEVSYNVAKFDLELDIVDQGENFDVYFNYSLSLFEKGTIIRFSKYFEEIINEIVADSNVKLSEINVLSEDEKYQITHEFNTTEVDYEIQGTVLDLIEEQVALCPKKTALYCEGKSWTYDELNQKVNQLGNYLINVLNIGSGDRIGLYFGRSPEMIISMLAVLKSGATYISLDPENPSERITLLLEDSDIKLVLTNLRDAFKESKSEVKILDLIHEEYQIEKQSKNNPKLLINTLDPAYIIYTSGTTGRPKGVVIEHGSLVDYSLTFKNYFNITSTDKVIQQASPSFDTIVEEVFPSLLSGATIVIMPEGGRNIDALIQRIVETEATVLSTVPIVLSALNAHAENLKSLRVIVSGGDLLLPKHVDQLINHFDVYNTYGPSESTVCITYHKITSLENTSYIGKPIPNRQVYILDNHTQLCPVGVIGELCVGGKGLAKEYLNDSRLTKEKFIDNPIIKEGKIYRTGDAAKWRSDGTIEFLGRIDNQVKIRGIRIELGEVESQLSSIDAVENALVMAYGPEGNKQLVAYLSGNNVMESTEIRLYLSEKLPDYMIPSNYVWLDSFPLTSSGKIDRRALPEPNLSIAETYVAPENQDQELLVQIWSEVLGLDVERIGIKSDFFALGGHSLTAITVANKINKNFSVKIPLRDLFQHRTIAELSAFINAMDRAVFASIPKAKEADNYPLSSAQRRMYFLYELDKEGTVYNMPSFLRLGSSLDIARLESVFKALVVHHQSFRTIFEIEENNPVQRILSPDSFEIEYRRGTSSDIDTNIENFVRPFDLSKEAPIRVALMEVVGEDYLLLLDMHHIIHDGVSSDILMRDFWTLYHGETLSTLPVQYVDYAVWQQSAEHQDLVATHKSYWLEAYAEELTSLNLPIDYPRSLEQSNLGAIHSLTLNQTCSDKLRELANDQGVTMYTLFLAIYNVLLNKLSNQNDIVIGTATAGRHHADIEGVVGMFVNTLPLRNQLKWDLPFKEFLSKVQENTLMAFDHQFYQYEELVDALEVSRDTGRNPLFDVFFSYGKNAEMSSFGDSELTIKGHEVPYEIAKFDLSLAILDAKEIEVSLSYKKELFNASSINRFSTYLERIIESVIENETLLIGEIDVLSEEEKSQLLIDFNDTNADYALDKTVIELFKENALLRPDAEAIIFEEERLTYAELDARSEKWALNLIRLGVDQGTIVGLMTSRSSEMITGILAIMKAGAAYLPINPDQPLERTDHMLNECECQYVLTNLEEQEFNLKEDYKWLSSKTLDVEQKTNKEIELPVVSPEDQAYVIYTSGSTGLPKGVSIRHKGLSNLNNFQREFFQIGATDRILQFSPYYFDASVEQIWLALGGGGALILVKKEMILDTRALKNYLSKNEVSYIHSTPSFLENLSIDELPSIRIVISGGEKCKPALANRFVGKSRFINEYGPTEGTVVSMAYEVHEAIDLNKNIPIGRPISNTGAYILGPDMGLVPCGVIGELYVGGAHLANGYVNRPELTSERFMDNPYGDGRLYRTGDLAKWLPDGNIEFAGRNDDQVKIRGYRIELGEIESCLESLSGVDSALVLAHGSDGDQRLVAYLSGEAFSSGDVRSQLGDRLPEYMVPVSYMWLDRFPLTANGKVDRRGLPAPDLDSGVSYVAPVGAEEGLMAEIWSDVLDLELSEVGTASDFFVLGGHSLKAITLVNRINKGFSVELPLRDLFVHRTISALVLHLGGLERSEFVSIPKAVEAEHYPLSSAQRRMYFLYEFDKGGTTYNMPGFFRIGGSLEVSRLEGAFRGLVARHASLRTIFEIVDDAPVQRILGAEDFVLARLFGRSSDISRAIESFVRPFDLSTELPLRVALMEVEDGEDLLMIDMHHIVNDGVSHGILMGDFWSLYNGEELSPLPLSYTDYAVWQQGEVHQGLVSSDRSYWLELFSDELITLELPTDRSRGLRRSDRGGSVGMAISGGRASGLRSLAADEGVTMYTLFLSLYNVLLQKLGNQDDIVVGTPTAGRHHGDLEGIVGMFVNTLALRNRTDGGEGFRSFVNGVQERTLSAFEHQRYQYEELVDALDLSRDAGRNPLFDVFFSYGLDGPGVDFSGSGIRIRNEEVPYEVSKFDLQMDVSEDSDGFGISLTYSASLFDVSTAERFLGYFERIVTAVLEDADVRLSDIDVLSEGERSRLLIDFNDTATGYDLGATVLDMFRERAQLSPDAEALVFGEQRVAYGELDHRSDLWASGLLSRGISPGSIVGLVMERSTEMITAILAVMKAGAAYMIINPDLPNSRSTHMMDQSGSTWIITNMEERPVELSAYNWLGTEELEYENKAIKNIVLPKIESGDLAYILYTSGSTGMPKGCMITHKNLFNYIHWSNNYYFANQEEGNWGLMTPMSFDLSVTAVFTSLVRGKKLYLCDERKSIDQTLKECFDNTDIDILKLTPTHITILQDLEIHNTNINKIICGGEQLKKSQIAILKKINSKIKIYNEYGPTETTVGCIVTEVKSNDDKVLIGKPIANTQIRILDTNLNVVPIGTIGEIYISGIGVSKGYINNPTLTSERFFVIGDSVCYKTGDLGKWNYEGKIEYTGRIDDQVKIRGYRIELGEIESCLESLSGVDSALVVAHGSDGDQRLVAYLSGEAFSSGDVRSQLGDRLPEYMVPVSYMWLDRFPLTANGKVDRRGLPAPDLDSGVSYVAPVGAEEGLMAEIWSDVLDLELSEVGTASDFFVLGGHSLKAITLVNRINKGFSVELPLRDLFVHRTISALVLHLGGLERSEFVSIPKAVEAEHYPLSSAQRRMYFLYEFDKGGTTYNMPGFFRIGGSLEVSRLEGAFRGLVARHASLRTIFEIADDAPVQRILGAEDFVLARLFGRSSDISRAIESFVRPFDLSTELPLRVALMEVEDGEDLLMIDMHHIVNDGVSHGILMGDFWSLYNGEELSPLPLSYTDYAVWQQGEVHQGLVSSDRSYWLELFSDELITLELPTDRSRGLRRSDRGGSVGMTISGGRASGLRSLAADEGVTMYTLFLSLYNVLLQKLGNQDDIVVGTPTAGRHHGDLEGIVGMFVNTLALRNRTDGGEGFRSFVNGVQERTLSAFEHQRYQYEELVDALDLSRDAGRNPLFDVFFSYGLDGPGVDFSGSGIRIRNEEVPYEVSKFDLQMDVSEDSDGFGISLTYSASLFDASTAERFLGYFERIVTAVLEDADVRLSDIDVLSEGERSRLLIDFNDTAAGYDLGATVLDMFRERAQLSPDAEALVFGEQRVAYGELDHRSDLWASGLLSRGISPGSIVGLVMERSTEMITAILAVMKAGAAYLPINPDQPVARTQHMLDECEVAVVLTNIEELPIVVEKKHTCLRPFDLNSSEITTLPFVSPEDQAYVIYTSGSTGLPKGVSIGHKSLTNFVNYGQEFFNLNNEDRILQFSPYYFDVSVEQIWLALTSGANLVLIEREILMDVDLFSQYLKNHEITHLNVTPSFLEHLVLPRLENLKRIVVSGEACKPALAEKYSKEYDFYNEYGPTEATIISISHKVNPKNSNNGRLPIGRPISNTGAYILGPDMGLVPCGVIGELYVGGAHLANGYVNRPELTSERFMDNPYGDGRLYRTGDLAKWLPDGNIEFAGRNDDQVKIRGYRIELGEIESCLESLSGVDSALVLAHGSDGDQRLVAYLSGEAFSSGDVRSQLGDRLPEYMVPVSYMWLDRFPLTANGKVDRRGLPAPDLDSGVSYVAPVGAEEGLMAEIWSDVLDLELSEVGTASDFFVLGGHSLKAITLVNRINKGFSVELPLRDLFVHRTISALVLHLGGLERSEFVSIPKAVEAEHYPLSSAQRRMYFLYEFDKGGTTYNMPGFFRIGGSLEVSRLEGAFRGLVARHASLRTIFEIVDDAPVQRILGAEDFVLARLFGRSSDISRAIESFVRPFDLSTELPLRVALMEVEDGEDLLMIDMHHIVNDGVSHGILMGDFWSLYNGEELSPLPLSYTDYAVWQQGEVHQGLVSSDRSYWLELFSDELITLELPTDRSRGLRRSDRGGSVGMAISGGRASGLRSLAADEGVTMYTLFLSLYNVLLQKLGNQDDIVVGTPTAGRHHGDLEGIVGMFVNTLALRNRTDGGEGFRSFVNGVQERTLSAFEHQRYQYEELVDALDLSRDAGRNPLFDVFFSYGLDGPGVDFSGSGIRIRNEEVPYEVSKFDLQMDVSEDSDGFGISLTYSASLFDASTAERFLGYFERIVTAVLEDADVRLSDIDVLSEGERSRLLIDFNDTAAGYDLGATVLDMFRERAQLSPDAEALVFGEQRVAYGELDHRSDLWASGLLSRGVSPGSIVGLVMERSTEMITAILAVMKAGAAYLPINPDQPVARTQHMLDECEVAVVLTNTTIAIENNTNIIWLDPKTLDKPQEKETQEELPLVNASSLAYIIYTSGSTGEPKGVMIHHEGVSNLNNYQREFFQINSNDRILQFSPYYFDASVEQIWLALTAGVPLVLIEKETILDKDAFTNYLYENEISYIHSTPSFLENLPINELPSLRLIISAGEACKPSLANKLLGSARLINEYGPTEGTVISTLYEISEAIPSGKSVPIGRPTSNVQAYILDDNLNLLPQGVKGELYIGGIQLSKGYINKPELTEERFIENPFGRGRLYRTGDVVRWLPDGNLEYLGRDDDQVQIRGYRVELGEIESLLEDICTIDRSLVIAHGQEENKKLIAYVCGTETLDNNEMKSLLSKDLPDYMIPMGYIWLDSFPVTPNGKIDKRALPCPDLTVGEEYTVPQTKNQELLVDIWSEILGIEGSKISITSDFFSLGGHSLAAMKLKHQIKERFNTELSLPEIFRAPTVIAMAEKIKGRFSKTSAQEIKTIIALNEHKEKNQNLFMIHDGSGEIDGYLELSRKIEGYACYGIKSIGLDEMKETPKIDEIATYYIEKIKAVQETGPYHFLGWSLGGEIATEMTLQLEDAGEEVENLILIDSSLELKKPLEKTEFNIASEIALLQSQFGYVPKERDALFSITKLWKQFSSSEVFRQISMDTVRNAVPDEIRVLIPDFLSKNNIEIFDAVNKVRILMEASKSYYIKRQIKARTLYIWPTESRAIPYREKLKDVFNQFEVQHTSGNHFSVMSKPYVNKLAQRVENQLELIQSNL